MAQPSPRVLILGGTGMLGGALVRRLTGLPGWRVRRSQRREAGGPGYFDALAAGEPLDRLLAEAGGTDFVINAIGLPQGELQPGGPAQVEAAQALNARLPRRLATAAARAGARVIHVSTDGVFSGKHGPYDEAAAADPEDLYGRTKLAGEVDDRRVLTLRCSIVGPDPERRRGLFEWFRGLGRGARARGFTDQRWNGVTTDQLADLCRAVIERGLFDSITAVASVRHFCPNRAVTKYQLLCLFEAALGAEVTIEPVPSGTPLDRVLLSRWDDLNALAGGPREMADAISEMVRSLPPHQSHPGKDHAPR